MPGSGSRRRKGPPGSGLDQLELFLVWELRADQENQRKPIDRPAGTHCAAGEGRHRDRCGPGLPSTIYHEQVNSQITAVVLLAIAVCIGVVGNWVAKPATLTGWGVLAILVGLFVAAGTVTWFAEDDSPAAQGPGPTSSVPVPAGPDTTAKAANSPRPSPSRSTSRPRRTTPTTADTTKPAKVTTTPTKAKKPRNPGGGPYPAAPTGYEVSVAAAPGTISRSGGGERYFELSLAGANDGELVRVEIAPPAGSMEGFCSTETKRCGLTTAHGSGPYNPQIPNFSQHAAEDNPVGTYIVYADLIDREITVVGSFRLTG